jgi:hypothetical protein
MIHLAMLPPGTRSNGAALALGGDIPPQFVLKVLHQILPASLFGGKLRLERTKGRGKR